MGPLNELPPELLIGWSLWVGGGLLLMLWFVRHSASPRFRHVPPAAMHGTSPRLSGSHAVARPLSGGHAVARQRSGTHPAARTLSGSYPVPFNPNPAPTAPNPPAAADAFDELRALLDPPSDPKPSR